MPEKKRTCPTCGGILRDRATRSLCPRCILTGSWEEGSPEEHTPENLNPPSPAELQKAFPDLEIHQMIGFGGMGIVYEVRQKSLERTAALKLLRSDSVNPEFIERLQREAKTLARLDHPNIVRIFDQGERGGWVFIIMEYVDGTDLSKILSRGKMGVAGTLQIADELCAALQCAHDSGVVHRDVKPANILVDVSGAVKVADFGLAKSLGAGQQDFTLTTGGSAMGTPLYMAPEQRHSSAAADARADVYSAGVVVYEMLTGNLPVGRSKSPSEVAAVPRSIDREVMRAIEPEPSARFRDAGHFRSALSAAAKPRPTKHWWAIAAVLALLAASAAIVFAPERPPDPLPLFPVSDGQHIIAPEPKASEYFGAIISAGADILAATNYKANPFFPFSRESGSVCVYQIGTDAKPGEALVLQASNPTPGDLYGNAVSVSRDGMWVAVSAPNHEPKSDRSAKRGAVEIFRRTDPTTNSWNLEDRVRTPAGFGAGLFRLRVTLSDQGLLAVGSVDEEGGGAVLVFRRNEEGRWLEDGALRPGEGFGGSRFGLYTVFSDDGRIITITAPSYHRDPSDTENGYDGGAFSFIHTPGEGWVKSSPLENPARAEPDVFGADITTLGDQLIVSAAGQPTENIFRPGRLKLYQREGNSWQAKDEFFYPDPTAEAIGFGFRTHLSSDGLLAATALFGNPQEGGYSEVVLHRNTSEAPFSYRPVAIISGKEEERLLLGRIASGEGFIAISEPSATANGMNKAGVIHLFQTTTFPATPPRGW